MGRPPQFTAAPLQLDRFDVEDSLRSEDSAAFAHGGPIYRGNNVIILKNKAGN